MLSRIGYDAAMAAAFDRWRADDACPGRVARSEQSVLTVLTEQGPRRATLGGSMLARIAAEPSESPAPGDWCVLRSWPDGPLTVERLLPRRTVLLAAGDRPEPAAANVDVLVVGPGRSEEVTEPQVVGATVVRVDRAALLDDSAAERLRDLAAPGRTLGLADPDVAGLLTSLVGARPLDAGRGVVPELLVLPDGGAALDLSRWAREQGQIPGTAGPHAARPAH